MFKKLAIWFSNLSVASPVQLIEEVKPTEIVFTKQLEKLNDNNIVADSFILSEVSHHYKNELDPTGIIHFRDFNDTIITYDYMQIDFIIGALLQIKKHVNENGR